jgi:hypothetical protein
MPYGFRKLYADLVTPDGRVCVLYLSWVRFGRRWHGRGGVERYLLDGRREVQNAVLDPAPMEMREAASASALGLELEGCRFRLELSAEHGPWTPKIASAEPALAWRVLAARTRAVARWEGPGRSETWSGLGYVDWVELSRFTRRLGFRRLRWGRLHQGESTLVFNGLETQRRDPWMVAALWDRDGPRDLQAPGVEIGPGGDATLRFGGIGGRDDHPQQWSLTAARLLSDGDAFDAERIPSVAERVLCHLVGGPTWQRRWFGAGHAPLDRGTAVSAPASALWEAVWFGDLGQRGRMRSAWTSMATVRIEAP